MTSNNDPSRDGLRAFKPALSDGEPEERAAIADILTSAADFIDSRLDSEEDQAAYKDDMPEILAVQRAMRCLQVKLKSPERPSAEEIERAVDWIEEKQRQDAPRRKADAELIDEMLGFWRRFGNPITLKGQP
jgi:hypothetical protein